MPAEAPVMKTVLRFSPACMAGTYNTPYVVISTRGAFAFWIAPQEVLYDVGDIFLRRAKKVGEIAKGGQNRSFVCGDMLFNFRHEIGGKIHLQRGAEQIKRAVHTPLLG